MKVFCEDCRHLRHDYVKLTDLYRCSHPENLVKTQTPDTWKEPGHEEATHLKHPVDINFRNQCPWFE